MLTNLVKDLPVKFHLIVVVVVLLQIDMIDVIPKDLQMVYLHYYDYLELLAGQE
jgi:hypothetical protein